MRVIHYLKAVVIVHGKSEKQICDHVKQQLRLKMEIISEKKGEKSIQITSLKNILNNTIFKSKTSFLKNFQDIELDENSKNIANDFKIFIIMDTDDCTVEQKKAYINKEMFREHWAYDYIEPIYNTKNLEEVLTKAEIPFKEVGNSRKKEYIKLFPTSDKYSKSDMVQIMELSAKLKKIKESNLDVFLDFCLKSSE